MRDDEKRIVHLEVDRHRGEHDPAQPAEDKKRHETAGEEQGRLEWRTRSAPERRDPAEDLNAGGNRDDHAGGGKEALAELRHRRRKHVVDPKPETDESRRDQRQDERRVTENSSARERWNDRRDKPGRRNENDVNLRMSKEPEDVLVEECVPAFGRIEEMGVNVREPIHRQVTARQHHRRHRKNDHEGLHDHRPDEDRDSVQRHANRAMFEDRRDNFHGADQGRDLGEGDHLRPEIDPFSG